MCCSAELRRPGLGGVDNWHGKSALRLNHSAILRRPSLDYTRLGMTTSSQHDIL